VGNDPDEEEACELAFRGLVISRALAAAAKNGEFGNNTLIFDSAAYTHIIWNSLLCHDVKPIESPYHIRTA
jgi:hypothetical protein